MQKWQHQYAEAHKRKSGGVAFGRIIVKNVKS